MIVDESQFVQNHHFVPKGYLQFFTMAGERSLVWEYSKRWGGLPRARSIKKICRRPGYYAQPNAPNYGKDVNELERALANMERLGIEAIRSIEAVPGQRASFRGGPIGELALFLGFLVSRNPSFREPIHGFYRSVFDRALEGRAATETIEYDGETIYVPEAIRRGLIEVRIKEDVSLEPMVDLGSRLAERLLSLDWIFVVPQAGYSLVTSDNPVSTASPSVSIAPLASVGPLHPTTEFLVPLRQDLGLVCRPPVQWDPKNLRRAEYPWCASIDGSLTKEFNRRTARVASERVYSPVQAQEIREILQEFSSDVSD